MFVCSLNVRSVRIKTTSLCNYIVSNNFDRVALTETWLAMNNDNTCIKELVPECYAIKHVTRASKRRGGGVALIYKSSITVKVSKFAEPFSQFESLDCTLDINGFAFQLAIDPLLLQIMFSRSAHFLRMNGLRFCVGM